MNHAALVKRAARWLELSQGCGFVITEAATAATGTFESPDAIGWAGPGRSILVECKVSRADFLADAQKPHRIHPTMGMGRERYYLTLPGLLKPSDLPERWGLLEVGPKNTRVRVKAHDQAFYILAEQRLLYSALVQSKRTLADLHRAWRRMGR
ncbi:MAG: hypothetical protein HOW73_20150 [Polyangiaceae bacterium]|nr:hypothetical protein [Polyangiaceae bacterium]